MMPESADPRYKAWYPAVRPPPEPNTFEIGLVLAGAVSAGAYTAGVLDFLFEALDTWHRAKLEDENAEREGEDRTVPHHKVRLHIITGASAGGMNGAISAVALRYDYPCAWSEEKIKAAREEEAFKPEWLDNVDRIGNPLYSAWVRQIDITKLLGTADLDEDIYALLDCTILEEIVETALGYTGDRVSDPKMRAWLPNPLPLILTVTNLRGVPYQIIFRGRGSQAHEMSLHEDYMAFAVRGLGPGAYQPLPDDFLVLDPGQPEGWQRLGKTALATGAFPVGLRARALQRDGNDYDGRHPIIPPNQVDLVFDTPAWPSGAAPKDYKFLCVDGGVMNNEPFEIARRALAGLNGHNERRGDRANRAVVMVDPFIEPGALGPDRDVDLLKVFMTMVSAMKNQVRFTPRDRALIQSKDVYSRFLVAPSRREVKGSGAIASGGLGAFMGFFSEEYRHHDFMLGRRNCQYFLQASFTLPKSNPVFKGAWSHQVGDRYRDRESNDHLQIIPCVGPCAVAEPRPAWPAKKFEYGSNLQDLVEERTERFVSEVLARLSGQRTAKSWWDKVKTGAVRAYLWPIAEVARSKIKAAVKDKVADAIAGIDGRFPDEPR